MYCILFFISAFSCSISVQSSLSFIILLFYPKINYLTTICFSQKYLYIQ